MSVCVHSNSYHIKNRSIQYARISLDDIASSNLYSYFNAAAEFIDQCNPMYTTSNPQNRILIHCAAGVSRSSSTVISYLIHRSIRWSNVSVDCLNMIRKRLNYGKGTAAGQSALRLNVAYYFVKSCRSVIRPNDGFLSQLEMWEQLNHKEGKGTRGRIPNVLLGPNETDSKLFEAINVQRENADKVDILQNDPRAKCTIL